MKRKFLIFLFLINIMTTIKGISFCDGAIHVPPEPGYTNNAGHCYILSSLVCEEGYALSNGGRYNYMTIQTSNSKEALIQVMLDFSKDFLFGNKPLKSKNFDYLIDESPYYEVIECNSPVYDTYFNQKWSYNKDIDEEQAVFEFKLNFDTSIMEMYKLYSMKIHLKLDFNYELYDSLNNKTPYNFFEAFHCFPFFNEFLDIDSEYQYTIEFPFLLDEYYNLVIYSQSEFFLYSLDYTDKYNMDYLTSYYCYLMQKHITGYITQDQYNKLLMDAMYYDNNNFFTSLTETKDSNFNFCYYSPNLRLKAEIISNELHNDKVFQESIQQSNKQYGYKAYNKDATQIVLKLLMDKELISKEEYDREIDYLANKDASYNYIRLVIDPERYYRNRSDGKAAWDHVMSYKDIQCNCKRNIYKSEIKNY